jgi:hypothetical protein
MFALVQRQFTIQNVDQNVYPIPIVPLTERVLVKNVLILVPVLVVIMQFVQSIIIIQCVHALRDTLEILSNNVAPTWWKSQLHATTLNAEQTLNVDNEAESSRVFARKTFMEIPLLVVDLNAL